MSTPYVRKATPIQLPFDHEARVAFRAELLKTQSRGRVGRILEHPSKTSLLVRPLIGAENPDTHTFALVQRKR